MEKQKKPQSYYSRINSNNTPECVVKHAPRRVLKETTYLDEGLNRIIRKSEFCTVDRQKEMENYKVNDFALENLLAIGADLQACRLTGSTDMVINTLGQSFARAESMTTEQ